MMNSDLFSNLYKSKKDIENIYIIGRGANTADYLKSQKILNRDNSVVITLNGDIPGVASDLIVFTKSKEIKSYVMEETNKSAYIVSSTMESSVNHIHLEKSEFSLDQYLSECENGVLKSYDFGVLSAIQISIEFSKHLKKKVPVYILGVELEFADDSVEGEYFQNGLEYTETIFSRQRKILKDLIPILSKRYISVRHIGTEDFSWMPFSAFVSLLVYQKSGEANSSCRNLSNSNEPIWNVKVVAECTTNHFGDTDRLIAMITRAASAGADFVKFQMRDVNKFYSRAQLETPRSSPFGSTFGEYRNALELTDQQFYLIDRLCNELGIGWFVSVLDETSFDRAIRLGCDIIKLPSTISERRNFLEYVSKNYSGTLVLSTGFTDQSYEDYYLNAFSNCEKLYILQCTSSYPTPDCDAEVAVVSYYNSLSRHFPNVVPGYSSHDIGTLGSQLAVACGAKMIEKHVKFGDTKWAHFDDVALDLAGDEFKNFVLSIRRAEILMGSGKKTIKTSENHKY